MRYDNDAGSMFMGQLPKKLHDLPSQPTVQSSRRLVSENDTRFIRQSTGHSHALLLPA